eukprot:m.285953 g.285953  ORF g.285953 m.285953 type:complete len:254 (-) comp15778_c0_seq22:624-1385(-)
MHTPISLSPTDSLLIAMAAHMACLGYDISLTNRTESKLDPLKENNLKILLRVLESEGKISEQLAALDYAGPLEQAVEGRDVIMLCVPATAHKGFVQRLAPMMTPNQLLVLHPGQMFGALEAYRMLLDINPKLGEGVAVAEIESSLLTSRATAITDVYVSAIKRHLGIATMPACHHDRTLACMGDYTQYLVSRDTVLDTSLMDLNAVVHPIITLLNAGSIDRGATFNYYQEGKCDHDLALFVYLHACKAELSGL